MNNNNNNRPSIPPVLGLSQLMSLDYPKVSLDNCVPSLQSVGSGKHSGANNIKDRMMTTESCCDICGHVSQGSNNNNVVFLPSQHRRHLGFLLTTPASSSQGEGGGGGGEEDDVALVLCTICSATVTRLLRLLEEVEGIQCRIRAVLRIRRKSLVKDKSSLTLKQESSSLEETCSFEDDDNVSDILDSYAFKLEEEGSDGSLDLVVEDEMPVETSSLESKVTTTPPSHGEVQLLTEGDGNKETVTEDGHHGSTDVLPSMDDDDEAGTVKNPVKIPRTLSNWSSSKKCYFCFQFSSNQLYLEHHMRSHTLERPLQPTTLQKTTSSGSSSSSHQCHHCGKVYKSLSSLKIHMKTDHEIEKILICNSDIVQPKDGNSTFKCLSPNCGKEFPTRIRLMSHMKKVHNIFGSTKCPTCGQMFRSKYIFQAHTHPDPENDPFRVTYTCPHCDKVFDRLGSWDCHIRCLHTQRKQQCEWCGRVYRHKSRLEDHLKECSSVPKEEKLKCSVSTCGRTFPTLKAKEDHERVVHKRLPRILCYFCGMISGTFDNLIVHMTNHTMERPYRCPKCGKDFKRSPYLRMHLATVCGEDEKGREEVRRQKREAMRAFRAKCMYPCNLCPKRFGQKPQLTSHKKREHHGC